MIQPSVFIFCDSFVDELVLVIKKSGPDEQLWGTPESIFLTRGIRTG